MQSEFSVSFSNGQIEIHGLQDATQLIAISGKKASRICHLAQHRADLEFAKECLIAINSIPDPLGVAREALWRSAVIFFIKCFGGGSVRSQLQSMQVFKNDAESQGCFTYFKDMRNKHFVHDENAFSQAYPAAAINDGTKSYKVERVFAFPLAVAMLDQANYSNLSLLIEKTLSWVWDNFEKLCVVITTELEKKSYQELAALPQPKFVVPGPAEMALRRGS
jgi:hypothetical protein